MKSLVILTGCLAILAIAFVGIRWVTPLNRVQKMRLEFETVAKGDPEPAVRAKMKTANLVSSLTPTPYWGDGALVSEEEIKIRHSIEERVPTFYIPVTFAFSFDANGRLVGKRIYD